VMESKCSKGKEIEVAGKNLKWLRKGTKESSSSSTKGALARMFGERAVETHGLSWSKIQKEVHELGLGYIFVEPVEYNLTLVREFYANWETSFGEITKVKIWGQ
ncbi:hypothetical protein HAX54_000616, partial [Datura stramonium]|nr:hypothetical protein [Datura stramonium]